ncbi:MAG: toprim domain-containing protein [Patescibacteria group bacterium]|nr:toprim domain-containing protein [Patescibacteria group bacterium]MCL5224450.1 toprim domain-containing protein [Patescibacteria group bacterium]
MKVPQPIKHFVEIFSELPGIGPRQAMRLAFYFIHRGLAVQGETIRTLAELKDIKVCKRCFYIYEGAGEVCDICSDSHRDQSVIAVVEKETDLLSLENAKKFNGRYLVIGDLTKSGILDTEQRLRLQSLKQWIKESLGGKAKEIIIAINPTSAGELIALMIIQELKPFAEKVTKLGRGIPTGGEIEFADEETLREALTRRD